MSKKARRRADPYHRARMAAKKAARSGEVERLARAMCKLAGHDPEEMVRTGWMVQRRWLGFTEQARRSVFKAKLEELGHGQG